MLPSHWLPHYTLADYRQWQGDWELIEGVPYAMVPSPSYHHQRVATRILARLEQALADCPHCHAVHETDWIVAEDTVVRPDIMILCGEVMGEYPTQTPAVIFEVVSPTSALRDEQIKFSLYAREGVCFYVLVYPKLRKARIFQHTNGDFVKKRDAVKKQEAFEWDDCKFQLDFSRIWEDSQP